MVQKDKNDGSLEHVDGILDHNDRSYGLLLKIKI